MMIADTQHLLVHSVLCLLMFMLAGAVHGSALRGLRGHGRRALIESGSEASVQDFPYIAMVLRPEDSRYMCTGTLVHPRVVLTAAHCVVPALDGRPNPLVQLGRQGSSQRSGYEEYSTRSLVHPRFQLGSFDFDIAALVLDRPATATPVRLVGVGTPVGSSGGTYHGWLQLAAQQLTPAQQSLASTQLLALGWGATGTAGSLPSTLQQGSVTPVALDKCQQLFAPFGSRITPRMVCVTGRTCAGDSGGPLLLPDKDGLMLVGQVSFGFPRRQGQQGCPYPNPVTAFTDLSAARIRDWLQQAVINRTDDLQKAAAQTAGSSAESDNTYQLIDDTSYDDTVGAAAVFGGG